MHGTQNIMEARGQHWEGRERGKRTRQRWVQGDSIVHVTFLKLSDG